MYILIYTAHTHITYMYVYIYISMVDWNAQFITLCGLKKWLLAFHHCPYVGLSSLSSALQHAHPTAGFLVRSIKATPTLQNHLLLHLPSRNLTWQWKITISSEMDLQMLHPPQKNHMDYSLKANSFPEPPYFLRGHEKQEFPPLYSMQNQMAPNLSIFNQQNPWDAKTPLLF